MGESGPSRCSSGVEQPPCKRLAGSSNLPIGSVVSGALSRLDLEVERRRGAAHTSTFSPHAGIDRARGAPGEEDLLGSKWLGFRARALTAPRGVFEKVTTSFTSEVQENVRIHHGSSLHANMDMIRPI